MALYIFWISASVIFYAYAGYPTLIALFARLFGKENKKADIEPYISIVVAVYNEELNIRKKLENLLSLAYAPEKKEILIGSDCSTDSTDSVIKEYAVQGVKYFRSASRAGKPAMLNTLVSNASGEIIVFTDARQQFDVNALRELVGNFYDPIVGCVSGELVFAGPSAGCAMDGVGFYWEYEKFLRKKESLISSMLGATGAIYAIRKNLFSNVPANILLDDMYIPLNALSRGYRAVFDNSAKAYDNIAPDMEHESKRKIRTLAGNWQLFFEYPGLFNPFKSKVAFQLFSHKLLRVAAPYFLISLFLADIALAGILFYRTVLILQSVFYLSAFIGFMRPEMRGLKFVNIPYVFCGLNISAVLGFISYITGSQSVVWKR